MNRRAFFSALAAVGAAKAVPNPAPSTLTVTLDASSVEAAIDRAIAALPERIASNEYGLRIRLAPLLIERGETYAVIFDRFTASLKG